MKKLNRIILFLTITFVCLFGLVSCKEKEQTVLEHINQLEELTEYEYSEYFSSLVEFGYRTYATNKNECFTATTDAYLTDLMSEEGFTYSPKEYVPENQETDDKGSKITYGTAFRIHFKGGKNIAKIEFDIKVNQTQHKIISTVQVFSTVTDENNFIRQCGVTFANESDRHSIQMNSEGNHFEYNLYYVKNNMCVRNIGRKVDNAISDSIIFKFCQGSNLETYASFGITISNLKITMM